MRLIDAQTLEFKEFFENALPEYAILSHTWEQDEVLYQQFLHLEPATKLKAGYLKIEQTCKEARKRGLGFVWVDTCCIDKSSSAELSEAINSMFRWYQEAEVCFAYLVDVLPTGNGVDPSFKASRWFTRGWTLQELLAPQSLDFFASDWTLIASRKDLSSLVSKITRIDEAYLVDSDVGSRTDLLSKASIAQKMSWASKRKTHKDEDIAYSLLGIFGVHIPLIYGEGRRAFLRLQEEILRSAFDPTILAWNAEHEGEPMLPEQADPYCPWRLALDMLLTKHHPWLTSSQPPTWRRPISHLAPGPEYFLRCKDIEPCEVGLDFVATNRGLEITLPVSQNHQPYAVIPCRSRSDSSNWLALPLERHPNSVYLRSCTSARMVSRHTWRQWPRQSLVLLTKHQENLDSFEKLHSGLWIRSLPETTRLLRVYSTEKCAPKGSMIQVDSILHLHLDGHELAALLLEIKDTNECFAIIIRPFDSVSISFRPLIAWRTDLECHIVKSASHDSLLTLLRTCSDLESMSNHLELQGSILHTNITRTYLQGRTVFEIDVKQSPNRYASPMISSTYTWLDLGTRELLIDFVLIILLLLATLQGILSVILTATLENVAMVYSCHKKIIGIYFSELECSESALREPSQVPEEQFIWLISRLYNGAVMATFAYQLIPIGSYFIPALSAFIRDKRWAAALFFGAMMANRVYLDGLLFCLAITLVCLWQYAWSVRLRMENAPAKSSFFRACLKQFPFPSLLIPMLSHHMEWELNSTCIVLIPLLCTLRWRKIAGHAIAGGRDMLEKVW